MYVHVYNNFIVQIIKNSNKRMASQWHNDVTNSQIFGTTSQVLFEKKGNGKCESSKRLKNI